MNSIYGITNVYRQDIQKHVHEIQGNVQIAEPSDPHSHRFATISGEAIQNGKSHYHEVKFITDYFREHYHEFTGKTSDAIAVGDKHVHYLQAETSVDDEHLHQFKLSTFIDNPML